MLVHNCCLVLAGQGEVPQRILGKGAKQANMNNETPLHSFGKPACSTYKQQRLRQIEVSQQGNTESFLPPFFPLLSTYSLKERPNLKEASGPMLHSCLCN
eukprot:3308896-Amphidinium_carterae.1